ncbi:ferredoxin [[Mycobacterium] wendilense]|uniref:Ferredoxin n=1 Tax=[Mycobacterium] wendilense TaxID=3064284 RepID=A0ABM9MBC6_9MYCO|nr:ferredoxin [Mycolicibacterium sp. MU0050]CAJ1581039.1 ferredoxin [Mycolicibacterium sp. MU0050]
MAVRVDTSKCSGIGLCEVTAPAVFEVGDDGQAHVLDENPPASERPAVEEAISNCPTVALSMD